MKKTLFLAIALCLAGVQAWAQWNSLTEEGWNSDRGDFAVADIDDDGDMDIIYSSTNPDMEGEENGAVWINDGNGNFSVQSGERVVKMGRSGNIDFGDIDGDGDLDVLFCGWGNGSSTTVRGIALNDGKGVFTLADKAKYPITDAEKTTSCGFADFNCDGLLDYFVAANWSETTEEQINIIYFQSQDGKFTENKACFPSASAYRFNESSVSVIDFNRDGAPDLWYNTNDQTKSEDQEESERFNVLFINDGTGYFTELNLGSGIGTADADGLKYYKSNGSAVWADVDGDGYLDLLHNGDGYLGTGEDNDRYWRLYRNNAGNGLETAYEFPAEKGGYTEVGRQNSLNNGGYIVDWDGDGVMDLITAGYSELWGTTQRLDWWKGNGENAMTDFTHMAFGSDVPGFSEQGMRIADLDGDGKADLLINGYSSHGYRQVGWVKNTSATVAELPGAPLNAVSRVDENGDVVFTWQTPEGWETKPGLTYNLYLYNKTTGKYHYNPMADLATGKRKVAGRMGNMYTNTSCRLSGLPNGEYEWAVQAVNGQYMGGMFMAKQEFRVDGPIRGTCGAQGRNLQWTLTDDGMLTIRGTGEMADYEEWETQAPWRNQGKINKIVIAEGVTSIGGYAFYQMEQSSVELPESLQKIGEAAFIGSGVEDWTIRIPDGVTQIGASAFQRCGLKEVILPDTTLSIGADAFANCWRMASVTIPRRTISIGNRAFGENPTWQESALRTVIYNATQCTVDGTPGWKYITSLTIGKEVKEIPDNLFAGCSNLKSVSLPTGVEEIGCGAFKNCRSLTSVAIPDGIYNIKSATFDGCSGLEQVSLPASVSQIDSAAFKGCGALKSIVLPEHVQYIGKNAFNGCTSLTSIEIPERVENISHSAFYGCPNLTTVNYNAVNCFVEYDTENNQNNWMDATVFNLGGKVETVSAGAILECRKLEVIEVDADNPIYSSLEGVLFSKDGTRLLKYPAGKKNTEYSVPESTTHIGSNAFSYASALSSLEIPDGITAIGENAFAVSGLTSAVLPSGLKFLDSGAFQICQNLTSVVFPGALDSIGNYAFYGCTALPEINLPESVQRIGEAAFYGTKLTSLTIPENVEYIGRYAFGECRNLKELNYNAIACAEAVVDNWNYIETLNIGENVALIQSYSFSACDGLTEVTIPENVQAIGYFAFSNCHNLATLNYNAVNCEIYRSYEYTDNSWSTIKTLNIGDKVEIIPAGAFDDCQNLTEVTIPESVKEINSGAFRGCDNLATVNFNAINCTDCQAGWGNVSTVHWGDKVRSVPNSIFSGCNYLTDVTLPSSVTSIGRGAFSSCPNLSSINIPESVTSIGSTAFEWCESLASIVIPASVDSIKEGAFQGCTGLTSVVIPEGVKVIDSYAFTSCQSLTAISIPESVLSIGEGAFADCYELTTLNYNAVNCEIDDRYDSNWKYITTLNIGDKVEVLPDYSFRNKPDLASVTIPESMARIGKSVFSDCPNLTTVNYNAINCSFDYDYEPTWTAITTLTIGGKVESIPSYAFSNCRSLTSVTLPESIKQIGIEAFSYCQGLTSITIPAKVESIGTRAFSGSGLATLNYNAVGCQIDDNVGWRNITTLNLGEAVEVIPDNAFQYCVNLSSVLLPDEVREIGAGAFMGCTGLTSMRIPEKVTYMDNRAFSDCRNLTVLDYNPAYCTINGEIGWSAITSLTIGEGVRYIPNYAFTGCADLTSVILPASVASIGTYAFANSGLEVITIPEGVTSIDNYAFSDCHALMTLNYNAVDCNCYGSAGWTDITDLTIGEKVESIPSYMLEGCTALSSVTLPESVERIGEWAFRNCNINTIIIPEQVSSIGDFAFFGCKELSSITSLAAIPPVCADSTFRNVNKEIPVYVPTENVEDYQAARAWEEFFNILPIGWTPTGMDYNTSSFAGNVTVYGSEISFNIDTDEMPEVNVFDMNGRFILRTREPKFILPQAGVYVIQVGLEAVKVVISHSI